MEKPRPQLLSIAGYDPTGGAGVLADVKTFEQFRCLGMAALSATTIQTPERMLQVKWFAAKEIMDQAGPLLSSGNINVVKIGLIHDVQTLAAVLRELSTIKKAVQVIWDPVLRSSSGFDLWSASSTAELVAVLEQLTLLTPNAMEASRLSGIADPMEAAAQLSLHTTVLLKGGHLADDRGTDFLFGGGRQVASFAGNTAKLAPKHGSGCILSSAIAACIAKGMDLPGACREAKTYIEKLMASSPGLLAYHAD